MHDLASVAGNRYYIVKRMKKTCRLTPSAPPTSPSVRCRPSQHLLEILLIDWRIPHVFNLNVVSEPSKTLPATRNSIGGMALRALESLRRAENRARGERDERERQV